jgi:hypothetical protein
LSVGSGRYPDASGFCRHRPTRHLRGKLRGIIASIGAANQKLEQRAYNCRILKRLLIGGSYVLPEMWVHAK